MPRLSNLPSFSPRRPLGKTGFQVTPIGIGDIADRNVPLKTCVKTLLRALASGLNLVDTAPGYEDGFSEEIVGEALRAMPRPRNEVFLIDKIDHLDKPVGAQVDESLAKLRLPYVDLFVFHAVRSMEAWEKLVAGGGGMDQLAQCRMEGKTRFRGVSSHEPDVLLAAIKSGQCDVVMFPVGAFVDTRFIDEVLQLAKAQNIGSVCFKTFGAGKLVADTLGYNRPLEARPRGKRSSGGVDRVTADDQPQLPRLTVEECVRYTLTVDPDVALLGMSFPNEQNAALKAAAAFKPMTPQELADVRTRAMLAVADKGPAHWNPAAR
jgi:aryl-alcohol dehydrogenase-like predicted oxidoreductase